MWKKESEKFLQEIVDILAKIMAWTVLKQTGPLSLADTWMMIAGAIMETYEDDVMFFFCCF